MMDDTEDKRIQFHINDEDVTTSTSEFGFSTIDKSLLKEIDEYRDAYLAAIRDGFTVEIRVAPETREIDWAVQLRLLWWPYMPWVPFSCS